MLGAEKAVLGIFQAFNEPFTTSLEEFPELLHGSTKARFPTDQPELLFKWQSRICIGLALTDKKHIIRLPRFIMGACRAIFITALDVTCNEVTSLDELNRRSSS